jgi:hypothetical protein
VDVVVLNVPPIFPEMSRDPVSAGLLACHGRLHRVRLRRAARLPDRCHVIDVDVEALVGCSHHGRGLRFALNDWPETD